VGRHMAVPAAVYEYPNERYIRSNGFNVDAAIRNPIRKGIFSGLHHRRHGFYPNVTPDGLERNNIDNNARSELFGERLDPLEAGFCERAVLRFKVGVASAPSDTCDLGDFVNAAGEVDPYDLADGPRWARAVGAGKDEIINDPEGDEGKSAEESLESVKGFPGFSCVGKVSVVSVRLVIVPHDLWGEQGILYSVERNIRQLRTWTKLKIVSRLYLPCPCLDSEL